MGIVVLTRQDKKALLDIVECHIDGLEATKQMVVSQEDSSYLLEAVAAVDEAIAWAKAVHRRINESV